MLEFLCIMIPFSGLVVAQLLRVRHLNRQLQQNLEQRRTDCIRERTRIARELHDSLLQGLQGTLFRLESVRRLLPNRPEEAAGHLDVAIDRAAAAINESRKVVGELRVAGPVGTDLAKAIAELGSEFENFDPPCAAPELRVLVQGRANVLHPMVRDEAYRIAREAVRNSFQHARAALVEVEIGFTDRRFSVRVRDDGIGIDPAVLEDGYRKGHWGLPGMRERALEFGGELEVWSERNAGTEIELRMDARIAYVRRPGMLRWRIAREN